MAGAGLRAAGVGVLWSSSLAVALASGPPVIIAEAGIDKREAVPADAWLVQGDDGWKSPRPGDAATAVQAAEAGMLESSPRETGTFVNMGAPGFDAALGPDGGDSPPEPIAGRGPIDAARGMGLRLERDAFWTGLDLSIRGLPARAATGHQLAQFQLPPAAPEGGAPKAQLPRQLTYQYAYGSESSVVYRRDADLNKGTRDNVMLVAPQVNGVIVYRPNDWLVATLEMIAEIEIPVEQEETVTLPNGETRPDLPTSSQLFVDQAFVTIRNIIAPFEFNVGRRNYEDERHWLYDASLDIVSVSVRQGDFRAEAFAGREAWKSWNLWPNQVQVKDRINTSLVYLDYRGIEDLRLAAYTIYRDDLTRREGRPRLTGVRAIGSPSAEFNFWAELAHLGGRDALNRRYAGTGYDVGFTYRLPGVPLSPSITLGYAHGSGDTSSNPQRNYAFRQTGLQSNEQRFAGVAKFKYYGEVLEPELSNIGIFTLGIGARLAAGVSIDLVYHTYRLARIADEVAGSPITAQMAQFDPLLSKRVGSELDLILGVRELFGIRRLGLDVRMGWFFPGAAFIRNDGDDENPVLRKADKGFTFVTKIWW
ncbi:MAG: alginate export family protein [Burkholderiales bacterium]